MADEKRYPRWTDWLVIVISLVFIVYYGMRITELEREVREIRRELDSRTNRENTPGP